MKTAAYILLFLIFTCDALAQDIHFSQFFTSPISLNPARTGLFNGDYRVGGNYKNQWNSVPVSYNTASIFADKSFGSIRNGMMRKAGFGIYAANDVAGDGNLSTTKFQLSGAFHQVLDFNEMYYVSGGVSVGFVQKSLDFTKLYWGNQWTGIDFNTLLDSKEQAKATTIQYPEINAGAEFTALMSPDKILHGGIALYHINKPKETFLANNNRIGMKPILNVGGSFKDRYLYELFTELFFSYQKKSTETVLSVIGGYNLLESTLSRTMIYAGLMYRYRDAVIPVVGYAKNNIRTYINYDVTLSKLTRATIARGGIEISVQYTYAKNRSRFKMKVPCSVF